MLKAFLAGLRRKTLTEILSLFHTLDADLKAFIERKEQEVAEIDEHLTEKLKEKNEALDDKARALAVAGNLQKLLNV